MICQNCFSEFQDNRKGVGKKKTSYCSFTCFEACNNRKNVKKQCACGEIYEIAKITARLHPQVCLQCIRILQARERKYDIEEGVIVSKEKYRELLGKYWNK